MSLFVMSFLRCGRGRCVSCGGKRHDSIRSSGVWHGPDGVHRRHFILKNTGHALNGQTGSRIQPISSQKRRQWVWLGWVAFGTVRWMSRCINSVERRRSVQITSMQNQRKSCAQAFVRISINVPIALTVNYDDSLHVLNICCFCTRISAALCRWSRNVVKWKQTATVITPQSVSLSCSLFFHALPHELSGRKHSCLCAKIFSLLSHHDFFHFAHFTCCWKVLQSSKSVQRCLVVIWIDP